MKKPTIKEIASHMNNTEEALLFFNYYNSQGWKVGRNPMKSWKSAASGWLTRNKKRQTKIEKAISNEDKTVSDHFWDRMTDGFGYKWTSQYGSKPTKLWINMLDSVSNEQIAHGLIEMMKLPDKWPPDVRQFYHLCKNSRPKLLAIGGMSRNETLALRNETKQARLTAMSKIKGLL